MQLSRDGVVRAEPNVTPMIDVMLVLLVIFMIVIPATMSGTAAIPPRAENLKPHPENENDLVLAIDRDGRYYLNRRPIVASAVASALRTAATRRADDHTLYVTAHKDLPYGLVADALGTAGSAGFRTVGLVSEQTSPTIR